MLRHYPALRRLLRTRAAGEPRAAWTAGTSGQVVEPGTGWGPLDAATLLLSDEDLDYPRRTGRHSRLGARSGTGGHLVSGGAATAGGQHAPPCRPGAGAGAPRAAGGGRDYLERQVETRPELQPRLAGLRRRLADPDALSATVREEVRERLRQATLLAALAAAEQVVRDCLRARLRRAAGPRDGDLPRETEERLLAAIPFLGGLRANRRLLQRLLRAYVIGDHERLARHPANAIFLEQLAARGVDVAAWLGEHRRRVPCGGVAGGWAHMALEREPLVILQMGTLFHTCLSAGEGNAHAAVANACELNKRVLYVRDAAGQVIGRKLIGINQEGSLIGYRTYSTLSDEGAAALRAAVDEYVRRVAACCGLRLADGGTVPRLFAQDWYDDGAVPWEGGSRYGVYTAVADCCL